MAVVIDNDAIKFLEEFKALAKKYLKSASCIQLNFKDGSTIGMGTVLKYIFGHITLEQTITGYKD